jgi:hypothetical protein
MTANKVIPEKVSKVFVIRHKDPGFNDNEVVDLANKIKDAYIEDSQKVALISSDVCRASSTASCFAKIFGVSHHINGSLYSEDLDDVEGGRPAKAINAISIAAKAENADVVIIVTHLEWTGYLPGFIKVDRFGEDERIQRRNNFLDYLNAIMINLQDPEAKDVYISP